MAILRPVQVTATAEPESHARHNHGGHEHKTGETQQYKPQLTSRISRKGEGGGRVIYIYINPGDCLESEDIAAATSYVNVWADSNGHRHWTVKLAPIDALETGRGEPPPPPPPPTGGG